MAVVATDVVQEFLSDTRARQDRGGGLPAGRRGRDASTSGFMEDPFASARSFSTAGGWTIETDPAGEEFEVCMSPATVNRAA